MTASSEARANSQDWQKRYFDTLDSLESERRQFRAMEAALKRLVRRLGSASMGQSSQLDEQIQALQATLRRDCSSDELAAITTTLTELIARLDAPVAAADPDPPPAAAEAGAAVDAALPAMLCALLAELRKDSELARAADEVDSKLCSVLPYQQMPAVMSSVSALSMQRIRNMERCNAELAGLLKSMVARLEDISRWVSDQGHDQSQSLLSRETLNTELVGEMRAMGDSVESALDLTQIRRQLRARLDSIGRHLKQFRQRETARMNEMRVRNEQMQMRIAQLESEASNLHHQLSDEQRLSTIDALTNIPNRPAYVKRIQEEIHRWQRFRQPTCVAVWDIDHFKNINDQHGHRAGDRVLRAVADSLASRLRRTDFLARVGGEEFVMILCGTEVEAAMQLIERMRIAVSELKFRARGTPLAPVTISTGVTALRPSDSAGSAFDRADRALYQAKTDGRNRAVCVR